MLDDNLVSNSHKSYMRSWSSYCAFVTDVLCQKSVWIDSAMLLLFMAHLQGKGLQNSTISTTVSAIRYVAKHQGFQDPGDNFLVATALAGLAKSRRSVDVRMPITIPILSKLIRVVNLLADSDYKRCLLCAMFSLAFFGCLRIGEITSRSGKEPPTILRSDLHLDSCLSMSLTIRNYKHSKGSRPFTISFEPQPDKAICPVVNMHRYLAVARVSPNAPLFVRADGATVSRDFFNSNLSKYLKACSLNPEFLKGHSFRIGSASFMAQKGFSDADIQKLGRWHSDAFKKYIRNTSFTM